MFEIQIVLLFHSRSRLRMGQRFVFAQNDTVHNTLDKVGGLTINHYT